MADNVLGTLFGEIADAIRDKTGGVGAMKPFDFPSAIASIYTGGASAVRWVSNMGKFTPTSTGQRVTVNHGLGVVPDLVVVSMNHGASAGSGKEFYPDNAIYLAAGWHSDMVEQITGTSNKYQSFFAHGFENCGAMAGTLDNKITSSSGFIRNANTTSFGIGTALGFGVHKNVEYTWIAVGHIVRQGEGGADPNVHYVTFMSEDGNTELYRRPVADGDNCADVIARGLLATPTKESTVQYNYTYSGWASSAGGSASSGILNAVTADKTVYAAFTAATRYYTITWLDDDGSVLKTESLAYGATPSYTPEKTGYGFGGWNPAVTTVTGDVSYTASWTEKINFANASWTDIARISEAGEAELHFALGDRKEISFTAPDGTNCTMECQIIGFAHDTCADGTKAGITMRICKYAGGYTAVDTRTSPSRISWPDTQLRSKLNNAVLNSMPETLRSVIKSVEKKSGNYLDNSGTLSVVTSNEKLWLLSANELGAGKSTNDGTRYAFFGKAANNKYVDGMTSGQFYFTRSQNNMSYWWALRNNGNWTPVHSNSSNYVVFCFCV